MRKVIERVTAKKPIWPEITITHDVRNGKQDCRLTAEARPQGSHMTGVQELVPFSVDKWEPLEGLRQKVPNT